MNLVVGATGLLGLETCRLLTEKNRPVRALARKTSDPSRIADLAALGAEITYGDLRQRQTLEKACEGVDTVVSTASSMPFAYKAGDNDIRTVDTLGVINLIEAASSVHVDRFVYTSFSGNMDLDFPLRNAKRAMERHLQESGMVYTILRPSFFMEVWLSAAVGFDPAHAKAQIYGTGDRPISWISLRDVAAFAVKAIENPATRDMILELGGPQAITPVEAVKTFEDVLEQSFEVTYVSEDVLRERQEQATDAMQESFSGLMRAYAAGDTIDMGRTLEELPVRLTSVREYAQSVFDRTAA